ncbi:hypothetical protein FHX15_001962 [Rhizobium sp. BK650]|uniref:hypothetical protein n=1 Tax=Rhizobium sp. BK650 TaxID=2586990 RepID=UPI0016145AA3|nr:hypothetical protein [Rhizobium sp. BK650]MBB3656734.1 hypothetical protein [Rhizobium sp. BK650]
MKSEFAVSHEVAKLIASAAKHKNHPRFRQAVAHYCDSMSQPAPEGWPIWKLLNQFSRYFATYLLIHNYVAWEQYGEAHPTAAVLQKQSGLSPRQTVNLVNALKAGRLVTVESLGSDRRVKFLRPSPEIIREIGRSMLAYIQAEGILTGEPLRAGQVARDPDLLADVICHCARFVRVHGTVIHPFPTILSLASRDCGYLLLVTLMAAHYRRLEGRSPITLSTNALAKRYDTSSSHVANVLRGLRDSGDFSTDRYGFLEHLSADFVDEFETWSACEMLHYTALADAAVARGAARPYRHLLKETMAG